MKAMRSDMAPSNPTIAWAETPLAKDAKIASLLGKSLPEPAMRRTSLLLALAATLAACGQSGEAPRSAEAAAAKPKGSYGGAGGADMTIDAIQPADEPVTVGNAGDDPADIARYILANGPS